MSHQSKLGPLADTITRIAFKAPTPEQVLERERWEADRESLIRARDYLAKCPEINAQSKEGKRIVEVLRNLLGEAIQYLGEETGVV